MAIIRKKKGKEVNDVSAEERILAAARNVFLKKGFKATRTRDIADEAGINLALLNYYFRSKEKLFDLIMLENMQQFMHGVYIISHDESTTWQQKVDQLVVYYIDMLLLRPDIPLFVLNEIRNNPEKLAKMFQTEAHLLDSALMHQLQQAIKKDEIMNINPMQFMANIMGLTVFPFVAAPLLKLVGKLEEKQFKEMMEQRKILVPEWIKATMYYKPSKSAIRKNNT